MKFKDGMDTGSESLRKEILKFKIPNVLPFMGPNPFKYDSECKWNIDYLTCGNYYEVLYGLGKFLKFESFLEFGVRYGYSAMAFAAGSRDTLKYFEGWDIEQMDKNSNDRAIDLIESNRFITCDYKILNKNSNEEKELGRAYDMVYVDGDHREDPKWHDFMLALEGECKYMIVDDVKVETCDEDWWELVLRFVEKYKDKIEDYTMIETYNHGTGVVIFK